jgi:hypothetical protein
MPNLTAHSLDPGSAEGEHVRSFQMMARRLTRQPALAGVLVYKSGPLSDFSEAEIENYADVFRRGIDEVRLLVQNCVVRT